MIVIMVRLNVHEAKTHLSRYLDLVEQGETILLCRHNKPVAQIQRLPVEQPSTPRVLGLCKGKFKLTEAFFKPLPEDMLNQFERKRT